MGQPQDAQALTAESGNDFYESVCRLLSAQSLCLDDVRPHYLRTVNDLCMPEMARATQLWEMVKELASLRDGVLRGYVPYGLLQFLIRLAKEESLGVKKPIDEWLEEHAKNQNQELSDINLKLQQENQHKVLLVLVEHDEKGEVTNFKPYLRYSDFSPVNGANFPTKTVNGWEDFERKLQELFHRFDKKGLLDDLEVHFLVDPPLFDRPFHQIPVRPAGPVLGENHVVLLRHRSRILSSTKDVRLAWQEYADDLRPRAPNTLVLLQINPEMAALPSNKGLCFASFTLPPGSTCQEEKSILVRLLRYGVPYLYWLHRLPTGADGEIIRQNLARMLAAGPRTLAGFPSFLRKERARGDPYATEATFIWDDPRFCPFFLARSIRMPPPC